MRWYILDIMVQLEHPHTQGNKFIPDVLLVQYEPLRGSL